MAVGKGSLNRAAKAAEEKAQTGKKKREETAALETGEQNVQAKEPDPSAAETKAPARRGRKKKNPAEEGMSPADAAASAATISSAGEKKHPSFISIGEDMPIYYY